MLKIFVSFTFLLILTDVVRCKPDYIFHFKVDGWIKLHAIPATWEEAFLRCHYEGAVLASPLDVHLTNALHTVMTDASVSRNIFLGTHALYSEGDFFSVEGLPLTDMPIRWGAHGEGAGVGDCLTMHTDGRMYYMYTSSCTERFPYICYKKLRNETTLNPCGTFDSKYRLDERTGSCYKLHEEYHTWTRAHMICAAEGGYLVIINNKEEASVVRDMFPALDPPIEREEIHVGLRAWTDERIWLTIHGEELENVFNVWAYNQPDNYEGREFFGSLVRTGAVVSLNDVESDRKLIFVCEKDPTTTRFEPVPTRNGWMEKLTSKTDLNNEP